MKKLLSSKSVKVMAAFAAMLISGIAFADNTAGDLIGGDKGFLWQLYQARLLLLAAAGLIGLLFVIRGIMIGIKNSDDQQGGGRPVGKVVFANIAGGCALVIVGIVIAFGAATLVGGQSGVASQATEAVTEFER